MPEQVPAAPTFEAELAELEKVVQQLESGELSLEESLTLFERGTELSANCRKRLELAETKVEILMKRGAQMQPAPFESSKP